MSKIDFTSIDSAQVVIPCGELNETLEFFIDTLSFSMKKIYPADSPRIAIISGFGVTLRLEISDITTQSKLRLLSNDHAFVKKHDKGLVAPNGMLVEFEFFQKELIIPNVKPSFSVTNSKEKKEWKDGRAGMQYRDLVSDRLGGFFIASHIRILKGGPVSDYVHHHHIHFQIIYCYKGWVRAVYEDQGPEILMNQGDCVLQPPHIRHQVLECSDQFEVIEVCCPAEHDTMVDNNMELPTKDFKPERKFDGQNFIFHKNSDSVWVKSKQDEFESRDTGINKATNGLINVIVTRPIKCSTTRVSKCNDAFVFTFVLQGQTSLNSDNQKVNHLTAGDSFIVPQGDTYILSQHSDNLELLEISCPENY
tara:strand:+ start:1995 stop:3086 length:1092 start_codon:yes stop_codon:yes gene_type:complete